MNTPLCVHKYKTYLKYVNVLNNGAIILGKNFTIDGFSERPIRVITHVHVDHLNDVERSIVYSEHIAATPITLDLLEALSYVSREYIPHLRTKSIRLEYHRVYKYRDESLELYRVDHIPGSAQVYVKTRDNDRDLVLGYTGDFKLTSETEIMQGLNVLVIESTYGNPQYIRRYKEDVAGVLVELVNQGLRERGRVDIYAYHGKIQEAMGILRNHGVNAPFILPDKIYRATRLLEEKYGLEYGPYRRENEAQSIGREVVVFKHFNTAPRRKLDGQALHIVLTGRLIDEPYRKIDEYTYLVSLSDHADFPDLVKYVEYSNPELVVVDGSRPGDPDALRSELIEKGFCAVVLPGGIVT